MEVLTCEKVETENVDSLNDTAGRLLELVHFSFDESDVISSSYRRQNKRFPTPDNKQNYCAGKETMGHLVAKWNTKDILSPSTMRIPVKQEPWIQFTELICLESKQNKQEIFASLLTKKSSFH